MLCLLFVHYKYFPAKYEKCLFLGENTLGVLFPVSKHMRGGAENNEASPRHLPTSFQENTTHTPSSVRRGWLWKLTLWIKIWSWESGLLKFFSVSHGPDANSREIFLLFLCDLRAAVHEFQQNLHQRALHPRLCHYHQFSLFAFCEAVVQNPAWRVVKLEYFHRFFCLFVMGTFFIFFWSTSLCSFTLSSKTRLESVWQQFR